MTAAVTLDRVTYRYPGGRAGIFDLSLDIAQGELIVCIGPSGCGKTTLLKLIAGFLRPDAGRVLLHGDDATHLTVRDRQLGIVFQSYALFPHMRVWENVAYPLRVRGTSVTEQRQRASEVLERTGLVGLEDRLPAQLSGGQQQRVALARALVFGPRALLLDEPLSALDAATRVTMRDEVRRIQRQHNIATLLITHDQDEALSLADRILILREGRLVQVDPPRTIYDHPRNGFVAGFVGRANVIRGTVHGPDTIDSAVGRLVTPLHGHPAGEPVAMLVRPERIITRPSDDAQNVLVIQVVQDRFYGATRQLDVTVRDTRLLVETTDRDPVTRIGIPRDAIQFLGKE